MFGFCKIQFLDFEYPGNYPHPVDKCLKYVDKSYFGRIWTKLDCNLDFMLAVTNSGITIFFN